RPLPRAGGQRGLRRPGAAGPAPPRLRRARRADANRHPCPLHRRPDPGRGRPGLSPAGPLLYCRQAPAGASRSPREINYLEWFATGPERPHEPSSGASATPRGRRPWPGRPETPRMRLSTIKLAGFKSFVDPTVLHLPTNMTGVVGPNGCGKSNIIDAVRWVMGESSASRLRGDSLTDVIFSGSSARKPVSQATVELIFDNSDGAIGGEYA